MRTPAQWLLLLTFLGLTLNFSTPSHGQDEFQPQTEFTLQSQSQLQFQTPVSTIPNAQNYFSHSQNSTPLCGTPKIAPEISFTLASLGPNSLRAQCELSVRNAINLGFTSVSLVPARVFDGHNVVPQGTATGDEISQCLEVIWNSGLNIVYQPHLESDYLLFPNHISVWRGEFDFAPDRSYEQYLFDPFFSFLENHKDQIHEQNRSISLMVAGELEISVSKYPAAWTAVVEHFRNRLQNSNLSNQVSIGFNPNWWPKSSIQGAQGCSDFKGFVKSLDFIAPSFYGDWSKMMKSDGKTPRGRVQVKENMDQLLRRLTFYPNPRCEVPEFLTKVFYIGEFGVGGDPQHAERGEIEMMKKPGYLEKRRAIYSNILDWAKNDGSKNFKTSINFWTGGSFDPVGVTPSPEELIDGEIAKKILEYKSWRCDGRRH